jgi:magnesium-transporting ATPase (P-type)
MIERVHEHIIEELKQNTRTDTIFIVTSILLNLLTLAINSGFAQGKNANATIVMFIFVSMIIVVNLVVIIGVLKGKQTRSKLLTGLLKMYKDQGVDGYYDPALLNNYSTRYNLFILVVVFLGLIAIIVPFILK